MICMRLANCPEWIWRRDRSLWHSNLWYRNQNLRCNADDNIFAWVNLDHYLICQLYRTKKNIINRGNTRSDTGYFFYFNIANSNISLKSAYIEFGARQSRMLDVRGRTQMTSPPFWDFWPLPPPCHPFYYIGCHLWATPSPGGDLLYGRSLIDNSKEMHIYL